VYGFELFKNAFRLFVGGRGEKTNTLKFFRELYASLWLIALIFIKQEDYRREEKSHCQTLKTTITVAQLRFIKQDPTYKIKMSETSQVSERSNTTENIASGSSSVETNIASDKEQVQEKSDELNKSTENDSSTMEKKKEDSLNS
jgi:hypothetical protein